MRKQPNSYNELRVGQLVQTPKDGICRIAGVSSVHEDLLLISTARGERLPQVVFKDLRGKFMLKPGDKYKWMRGSEVKPIGSPK